MGKILDVRTPSPGRLSVLEKAMRNFAERKSEFVIKPETGQEFDALPQAYDFCNLCYLEIGFRIKYGKCRRNVQKCKIVQNMVWSCGVSLWRF